jgi:hypothetical protein
MTAPTAELKPGRIYFIDYRCTTPGPEVEQGTVHGYWNGEIDTWGKYTIVPTTGTPRLYLFRHEMTSVVLDDEGVILPRARWRQIARQAQDLATGGRNVDAIKLLRTETGCGLSEAYHAVQRLKEIPPVTGGDHGV